MCVNGPNFDPVVQGFTAPKTVLFLMVIWLWQINEWLTLINKFRHLQRKPIKILNLTFWLNIAVHQAKIQQLIYNESLNKRKKQKKTDNCNSHNLVFIEYPLFQIFELFYYFQYIFHKFSYIFYKLKQQYQIILKSGKVFCTTAIVELIQNPLFENFFLQKFLFLHGLFLFSSY